MIIVQASLCHDYGASQGLDDVFKIGGIGSRRHIIGGGGFQIVSEGYLRPKEKMTVFRC